MPELPEIETLREQLSSKVKGAVILESISYHRRYNAPVRSGAVISDIKRRGKYILLSIYTGETILIHLGMSGQILWNIVPVDHMHYKLVTDNGVLYIRDPRRFGRVRLIYPGDTYPATFKTLGPEPGLGLDTLSSANILMKSSGYIKARLLEQKAVAGVGNYIADEALHMAKLHPKTILINKKQAIKLIKSVNHIMLESIKAGGVSERDYLHIDGSRGSYQNQLKCYGRNGLPCLSCGNPLKKIRVASRGSTFCDVCQVI